MLYAGVTPSTLHVPAAELAYGCPTWAHTQMYYGVRGMHRCYAVQVFDDLAARQAWEVQIGHEKPP